MFFLDMSGITVRFFASLTPLERLTAGAWDSHQPQQPICHLVVTLHLDLPSYCRGTQEVLLVISFPLFLGRTAEYFPIS